MQEPKRLTIWPPPAQSAAPVGDDPTTYEELAASELLDGSLVSFRLSADDDADGIVRMPAGSAIKVRCAAKYCACELYLCTFWLFACCAPAVCRPACSACTARLSAQGVASGMLGCDLLLLSWRSVHSIALRCRCPSAWRAWPPSAFRCS